MEIIIEDQSPEIFDSNFSGVMIGLIGTIITAFFGIFPSIIQSNMKRYIGYDIMDVINYKNDKVDAFSNNFLKAMCGLILIILLHIFKVYWLGFIISMLLIFWIVCNQSKYLQLMISKNFYNAVEKLVYSRVNRSENKKYELMVIAAHIDLKKENDITQLLEFSIKPIKIEEGNVLYLLPLLEKKFADVPEETMNYLKYVSAFIEQQEFSLNDFEIRLYNFKNFIINNVNDININNFLKYINSIIKFKIEKDYYKKEIAYNQNFEFIYDSLKNNHVLTDNRMSRDTFLKNYDSMLNSNQLNNNYLKYIYTFYLFKYFIDNLDEDGFEYILNSLKKTNRTYLKYVVLSIMTYLYYLSKEDDRVFSQDFKYYVKVNLEDKIRKHIKKNTCFMKKNDVDLKDYFHWINETIFKWKKYVLSFGETITRFKYKEFDNIISCLKKTVIILKFKSDNNNINLEIIASVIQNFNNKNYDDILDLIRFIGFDIKKSDIKKNFELLERKYKENFIKINMNNHTLNADFKISIENSILSLEEKLNNNKQDFSVETKYHNMEIYYILKNSTYNDVKEFTSTSIYTEILDYIQCEVDNYIKVRNVNEYYIKIAEIDISTLTIGDLELSNKNNLIDYELLYCFKQNGKKYSLSDGYNAYSISKSNAKLYLENNYSIIRITYEIKYQ